MCRIARIGLRNGPGTLLAGFVAIAQPNNQKPSVAPKLAFGGDFYTIYKFSGKKYAVL